MSEKLLTENVINKIFIAHRGNIGLANCRKENSPEYIDEAIKAGFDVEIDVWYVNTNKFFLGHDGPQYEVDKKFFEDRVAHLWIHCKNIWAMREFSILNIKEGGIYNFFYHNTDDCVLTSCNYLWTYPGKKLTCRSIMVNQMNPALHYGLIQLAAMPAIGICSDNISCLKRKYDEYNNNNNVKARTTSIWGREFWK